ncbi:MAG: hypothetical protein RLZZ628_1298 [Bacteroidota bacterium]|jgi:hypothetical protein
MDRYAILNAEKERLYAEWATLLTQRSDASPDARGGIKSRMAQINESITEIEKDMSEIASSSYSTTTPEVHCAVLVSKRDTILNRMGQKKFNLVKADRYNPYHKKEYRPFHKEVSIDTILTGSETEEKSVAFNFKSIQYLGIADWTKSLLVKTKQNIAKIILIADPLTVSQQTKNITKCFDVQEAAGVIVPYCTSLYAYPSLTDEIKRQMEDNFEYHEARLRQTQCCEFYMPNDPNFAYVKKSIDHILNSKFKYKRQIQPASDQLDPSCNMWS